MGLVDIKTLLADKYVSGGCQPISPFHYFPIFLNYRNITFLLNMYFIFDTGAINMWSKVFMRHFDTVSNIYDGCIKEWNLSNPTVVCN